MNDFSFFLMVYLLGFLFGYMAAKDWRDQNGKR